MARVYTTTTSPGAAGCAGSARSSAASSGSLRVDGDRGAGLEELRQDRARLQRRLLASSSTGCQRLQGHLFLNPDHLQAVPSHIALNTTASFVTNTNWQYYGGEYTMSYLTPDGRARGAELRLRRGRHGGARRGRARNRAPLAQRRSATSGATSTASLVYILLPLAIVLGVILISQGVAADVPRPRDRDDAPGRAPDDRARPGRLADRDQAARDERRRLLQLELRRPVREPERALELLRDARDPAHPGGAGVHVREDGRSRAGTPGWCSPRCSRCSRSASPSTCRRSSTARRCCATPA